MTSFCGLKAETFRRHCIQRLSSACQELMKAATDGKIEQPYYNYCLVYAEDAQNPYASDGCGSVVKS